MLPNLEFHNPRVFVGWMFAHTHKRPPSGFSDRLIFALCTNARRVIVIILYRLATGDDDRSLPRLR
jgi:hypothetical protein